MLKDIVEAKATGGHRLYLRFEDGVEGEVDLAQLIELKGVFEALKDPAEVARARVDAELGTVCWPSGADLDPDVLYAKLTGESIELHERMAGPRGLARKGTHAEEVRPRSGFPRRRPGGGL